MSEEILSGELARICGVSPDTIRHYERIGVIPKAVRGANGYRRFPRETADRVMLVRRGIAIGFSLEEIAGILRQRDLGAPPCRRVRAMAEDKLHDLDRRIAEMTAMREELRNILERWDDRLAATRDGEAALLLESAFSVVGSQLSVRSRTTDAGSRGITDNRQPATDDERDR